MPFVIDASIVLAWGLEEDSPAAGGALTRLEADQAFAPSLWWFEVRNGLIVGERRGRIQEMRTVEFLRALAELAVSFDASPDENKMIELARKHRLTVYDAAYLELAVRRGFPLATLDEPLAAAARAEGVPLVGESS
jgi:predicted nucleic acid-binding protein